jgi:exodeoxyribonuclease-3
MKIATFNVNDVKKRLPNLLGWLRRARPDVACLQELKTTDSEIRSRFGNRGVKRTWLYLVATLLRWDLFEHSDAI